MVTIETWIVAVIVYIGLPALLTYIQTRWQAKRTVQRRLIVVARLERVEKAA